MHSTGINELNSLYLQNKRLCCCNYLDTGLWQACLRRGVHFGAWSSVICKPDIDQEQYPDGAGLDYAPLSSSRWSDLLIPVPFKVIDIYRNIVFTYNDVADTVIQRFVAKVWNNLKACIVVWRLLKCLVTDIIGLKTAVCLPFETLTKINRRYNLQKFITLSLIHMTVNAQSSYDITAKLCSHL